ncbi:MAG TPA: hypothetical protein H9903_14420 [Candidatus Aquabacterium excrementipullorum]|nr:hypothetical protein [Candidatus Aquabacterium excrementipullorum]
MIKGGVAVVAIAALAGCAGVAPAYQPSISNVQKLQSSGSTKVKVGTFSAKPGAVGATSISLRAASISSPVGADFGAYLGEAVKQELSLAQRLDSAAAVEVSGILLGNDIDTAVGTASGYAEAQFTVSRDGKVQFSKTKRGTQSWESSFAGAVAIPKAQQSYPLIIQDLLSTLYSDPEFINALK